MIRERFDRAKAWEAFQAYVQAPLPTQPRPWPDDDAAANHQRRVKQELRYRAYEQVDEIVEIGVRQVFAKMGDPNLLDDLRQAARLRLYQSLPRMAEFCLNDEHYFRLSLSAVRWAALNEYSRVKRQSKREINNADTSVDDAVVEDNFEDPIEQAGNLSTSHDLAQPDARFEEREDRLLLNQGIDNIIKLSSKKISDLFYNISKREAAIAILRGLWDGREISSILLHHDLGVRSPSDMQRGIISTIRGIVIEFGVA